MSRQVLYVPKKANFGHFWAKNPNFYGRKQKFGTLITEQPPKHLICIVFGLGMGPDGLKMPLFRRFWAKNRNFTGVSKSFGTFMTENHLGTLFALFFGRAWDQMGQKCQIWLFLNQKSIFGGGSKTFGTLISGKQCDTSFVFKTLTGKAPTDR